MAVDSLRSAAQLLTEAYQPLHDTVHGRADVPEHHSLDTTFLAVKATADVRPCLPALLALMKGSCYRCQKGLTGRSCGVMQTERIACPWGCMAPGTPYVASRTACAMSPPPRLCMRSWMLSEPVQSQSHGVAHSNST